MLYKADRHLLWQVAAIGEDIVEHFFGSDIIEHDITIHKYWFTRDVNV